MMQTRANAFVVLMALVCRLASAAGAQPAFQVRDIGSTLTSTLPAAGTSVEMDGIAYFLADDGIHGLELWRSDGTATGTRLVRDVCPGSCAAESRSGTLAVFEHRLYWTVRQGDRFVLYSTDGTSEGTRPVYGPAFPAARFDLEPTGESGGKLLLWSSRPGTAGELWGTDGSEAGTVLLHTFESGTPVPLGEVGRTFLFSTGILWQTDGTAGGTVPFLPETVPGLLSYEPAVVAEGRLFFIAGSAPADPQIWVSDGTPAGTHLLLRNPSLLTLPSGLTALGSQVLFLAVADGADGLWKSDGTEAGTVLLHADATGFFYFRLTSARDRVFFRKYVDHADEVWASDGTAAGTVRLARFPSGAGFRAQYWIPIPFGDRLGFFADDGVHGSEPWASDGTPEGTRLLLDVNPGPSDSTTFYALQPILRVGDRWLFTAQTGAAWFLYASDGTPAGTFRIRRLDTQTSSSARPLADLHGTLLFAARDATNGSGLWRSDGSTAGTSLVKAMVPGRAEATIGGRLLFSGQLYEGPTVGGSGPSPQLWVTDGTAAGTAPLLYIGFTDPGVEIGNALFLTAGNSKREGLFKTDGTVQGTVFLHRFDSPPQTPRQLTAAGGRLFFLSGEDPRLWTSDGTVAGTRQVAPEQPFHNPVQLAGAGARLFFGAEDEAGVELWTSDGTAAGTRRVKDLLPGPGSGFSTAAGQAPVAAGGRLFFVGDDGVHGAELWTSDGTAAGTRLVQDVAPGAASSGIGDLTALGSRVFFTADDGVHGLELWTSDGTAAGTHLVADLFPGAGSAHPGALTPVDGLLLFAADDGVHGLEPWVSDGTAAGTRLLADVAPGSLPSSPTGFLASGNFVYFSANDGQHGFELWAVPRSALRARRY